MRIVALVVATCLIVGQVYGHRAFIARVLRTAHSLARDPRLPRWLRILFLIGCVQIPVLPFDEIALVLATAILAINHRPILRDAWATAAQKVPARFGVQVR